MTFCQLAERCDYSLREPSKIDHCQSGYLLVQMSPFSLFERKTSRQHFNKIHRRSSFSRFLQFVAVFFPNFPESLRLQMRKNKNTLFGLVCLSSIQHSEILQFPSPPTPSSPSFFSFSFPYAPSTLWVFGV